MLQYKKELLLKYAIANVNSKLSSNNCYLKFIGRGDCCVKTVKQQRRIFLPEEKELSKKEYEGLGNAARGKPRLCLLVQTICATGIRVSEHRFITVEAAKAGYAQVRLKGKSQVVFLPRKLCKALLKYAKQQKIRSGSIFITASGKSLNRCNIWAEMKKLCHTARVSREKVFPHNLLARTYYSLEKDIVHLVDILYRKSCKDEFVFAVWKLSAFIYAHSIS